MTGVGKYSQLSPAKLLDSDTGVLNISKTFK